MVMPELVIRDVPAMNVVSLDHVGSYMQIGKAFDALFGWLAGQPEFVVG
jgi:AraC family transcriptional regulator